MRHRTTNLHLVSLSFGSRLCESEVSGYYANELCARLKLALAHLHKRIKWFKARHATTSQFLIQLRVETTNTIVAFLIVQKAKS